MKNTEALSRSLVEMRAEVARLTTEIEKAERELASTGAAAPNVEELLNHEAIDEMKELMGPRFAHLLEVYLQDAGEKVAWLEGAQSAQCSASNIVMEAHALKSASDYIGAVAMRDTAREIEMLARENSADHVFFNALQPLLLSLRRYYTQTALLLAVEQLKKSA